MDPKIARGTFFFRIAHFPCNDGHGFESDKSVEDVDGGTRNSTKEVCSTFQLKERVKLPLLTPPEMKKMAQSEKGQSELILQQ